MQENIKRRIAISTEILKYGKGRVLKKMTSLFTPTNKSVLKMSQTKVYENVDETLQNNEDVYVKHSALMVKVLARHAS